MPPVELTRAVRFVIPLGGPAAAEALIDAAAHANTFAGSPAASAIGGFQELQITMCGEPDSTTGYLLNISHIDRAVRMHALPVILGLIRTEPSIAPAHALAKILEPLQRQLRGQVTRIAWRLNPYHVQSMSAKEADRVSISEQFEFSAAHRLHVETLTDQQNREVFGKCNNPNGHGHNYRIEPTISIPLAQSLGNRPFSVRDLERIVHQVIIQRFDHRHLNLDTKEFARLNPSVENIAKVCFDLLESPLADAGARLQCVTVWETEKTRCTYPAQD